MDLYDREFEEVKYTGSESQMALIEAIADAASEKRTTVFTGPECDDLMMMIHDLFKIYNAAEAYANNSTEENKEILLCLIAAYDNE